MDILETVAIAFQTLAANKMRSALTMLGVIIGVLSVVLLVALGEGARQYVTKEFAGLGSNILIVTPGKTETTGHMPPMAESIHKLTFADSEAIKKRARGRTSGTSTLTSDRSLPMRTFARTGVSLPSDVP